MYRGIAVSPMLYTEDIPATIEFYLYVLQFELVADLPKWGWARLKKNDIAIMLSKPSSHLQFSKPEFTGGIYFYVDQVDRVWESIADLAEVCYPIEDFSYGMREFGIYDNNGYLLQFGSTIENHS